MLERSTRRGGVCGRHTESHAVVHVVGKIRSALSWDDVGRVQTGVGAAVLACPIVPPQYLLGPSCQSLIHLCLLSFLRRETAVNQHLESTPWDVGRRNRLEPRLSLDRPSFAECPEHQDSTNRQQKRRGFGDFDGDADGVVQTGSVHGGNSVGTEFQDVPTIGEE